MKSDILTNQYFFVDESGDTTFYNRNKEWVVGNEGVSKILIMGFIRTTEPEFLRDNLNRLHKEIANNSYFHGVPSITKTNLAFHAKDDIPEVRYEVFKLLNNLPFSCNVVIARKTKKVLDKFNGNTNDFYDSLITNLFKNILQTSNNNYIYIATRGNRKRQAPLEQAIQKSIEYSEKTLKSHIDSKQIILPQSPSGEPCLQIVDYCNWGIQRAFFCSVM